MNPTSSPRIQESRDENGSPFVDDWEMSPEIHPSSALLVLLGNESVQEKYMRQTSLDYGDVYRMLPGFKNGRELYFDIEFVGHANALDVRRAFEEQVNCTMQVCWNEKYSFSVLSEGDDTALFRFKIATKDSSSRKVMRRRMSEFILLALKRIPTYRELIDALIR
jgi:hypothetical protein